MQVVNFSDTNSILHHFLKEIRSVEIQKDSMRFRKNMERIGEIMAYEISKTMSYVSETVQTPFGISPVNLISEKIVISTILRAGLPFYQGFLNFFDGAESAFASAYRKYKNAVDFDIYVEYIASPSIEGKTLILTDPMLATGSSMEMTYNTLLAKGKPAKIYIAAVIASQPAINYVVSHFPEEKTSIWAAAIDPELNEHSYIIPGLGDAGDLAFGEKI
ncbi:MAG TPA: uracil phosphoribosyltransferase [Paludibacteraceae bacterium]|nr:uracil phosphoribosyltransferase [Paludibacteraceae bacterium]